jgi:hypothetical protein
MQQKKNILTRFGGLKASFIQKSGEHNSNWRGDQVTIRHRHRRISKLYGDIKICEKCKTETAKRYDWANVTGNYSSENRFDWARLCRSCHMKLDKNWLKKDKVIYKKDKPTVGNTCMKCNKKYLSKGRGRQYCSKVCWYNRNKTDMGIQK